MAAEIVHIEVENGLSTLACPRCGREVFGKSNFLEDRCEHLVFVVDWAEELLLPTGNQDLVSIGRELESLWEEDHGSIEEAVQRLAGVLPPSAFVLEVVEPARGGGHDGSIAFFAFDLRR